MFEDRPIFRLYVLHEAEDFIKCLEESEQFKVLTAMAAVTKGQFNAIHTKTLRNKIKELIVKRYRFTFFIEDGCVYFVRGFIKKTGKTPPQEIEYAQKQHLEVLLINKLKQ